MILRVGRLIRKRLCCSSASTALETVFFCSPRSRMAVSTAASSRTCRCLGGGQSSFICTVCGIMSYKTSMLKGPTSPSQFEVFEKGIGRSSAPHWTQMWWFFSATQTSITGRYSRGNMENTSRCSLGFDVPSALSGLNTDGKDTDEGSSFLYPGISLCAADLYHPPCLLAFRLLIVGLPPGDDLRCHG